MSKHINFDGPTALADFKIRSSTYMIAHAVDSNLDNLDVCIDFIRHNSENANVKEVNIRLYTDTDVSKDVIETIKNSILNNFDNVSIDHIKNVNLKEMGDIMDFCVQSSKHDGGFFLGDTEQSKEQKEQEAAKHLP